jgi:adenylate cyclase
VEFLVGENTCLRASDGYRYRELDKIRMLGKETPVTVYELVGSASEAASPLIELFAAALQLYRARQWQAAREGFAAILQQFPTDRPSRIYLDRCDYFAGTPPADGWDGVFNRLDK